jgi:hypothetical protein
MRPIITYLRVSMGKQEKGGLGIEAQRQAIAGFAAAEGLELGSEFVEVETGKGSDALDRRARLAEALAKARKAKVPVVVAKLCRLSRDVAFFLWLMAQRVPRETTTRWFKTQDEAKDYMLERPNMGVPLGHRRWLAIRDESWRQTFLYRWGAAPSPYI